MKIFVLYMRIISFIFIIIIIIMGLAATVVFFANEARFTQI